MTGLWHFSSPSLWANSTSFLLPDLSVFMYLLSSICVMSVPLSSTTLKMPAIFPTFQSPLCVYCCSIWVFDYFSQLSTIFIGGFYVCFRNRSEACFSPAIAHSLIDFSLLASLISVNLAYYFSFSACSFLEPKSSFWWHKNHTGDRTLEVFTSFATKTPLSFSVLLQIISSAFFSPFSVFQYILI